MGRLATLRSDFETTGSAILDAVYPASCLCAPTSALATRPRFGLCDACVASFDANDGERCAVCDLPGKACCAPTADFRIRAPYLYGGQLAAAIGAIKFENRDDLARGLGRLLADSVEIATLARECDLCVPVPLASERARERGYNQSAILARALGQALVIPVHHALRRVKQTQPQHTLNLTQRRTNVANAFAVPKPRAMGHVLLVDDVVTSSETIRAAAAALLAGGANRVTAIALARTAKL